MPVQFFLAQAVVPDAVLQNQIQIIQGAQFYKRGIRYN